MDPLMTFWFFLIGIIVGVAVGLTLVHKVAVYPLHKKIERLEKDNNNKRRDEIIKKMKDINYPYSLKNFRFIGDPIDGLQFEENQILFVKLKTNSLKLNPLQKNVKKLVQQGQIKWLELKTSL